MSIAAACIGTSCDSGISTFETCYSNFIARQLYAQKCYMHVIIEHSSEPVGYNIGVCKNYLGKNKFILRGSILYSVYIRIHWPNDLLTYLIKLIFKEGIIYIVP